MRHFRSLVLTLVLAALCPAAWAAGPTTSPTDSDPMEKVLPEVKLNGVPLTDALDFLQEVAPGFSVVREGNDDVVQSTLVTMHMKNVTVRQVMQALQFEFPALIIHPLGSTGSDASIYIIGSVPKAKQDPVALQIFRLGPVIDAMASRAGSQPKTKPLDDIMSLIQATLSQVPSPNPPTLQVHEATQTLIFKGNKEQLDAVQKAMEAISPSTSDQAQAEQAVLAQTHDEMARLQLQLATEKAALDQEKQRESLDAMQRLKEQRLKELGLLPANAAPATRPTDGKAN